jgi:hypothetical protein
VADQDDQALRDPALSHLLTAQLARMLAEQNTPPPLVMELARQSFGLRMIDAELAFLAADSDVAGTAAAVRRTRQGFVPRLLTFSTSDLTVELTIEPAVERAGERAVELPAGAVEAGAVERAGFSAGPRRRVLGELIPRGTATIQVRQPACPDQVLVDADDAGRFGVEDVRPGPLNLIFHRLGQQPVSTEWTSLD